MSNNSYFGGIAAGLKTLAIGMKTTMKEYFTPKSTEQYPENRKTTLHVSPRFRGRLVFVRDENEAYKCVGCTLCEKSCPNDTIKIVTEMVEDQRQARRSASWWITSTTWATACSASSVSTHVTSVQSSLSTISRMQSSTATSW